MDSLPGPAYGPLLDRLISLVLPTLFHPYDAVLQFKRDKLFWAHEIGLGYITVVCLLVDICGVHLASDTYTLHECLRCIFSYLVYLRGNYTYEAWRMNCGLSDNEGPKLLRNMTRYFLDTLDLVRHTLHTSILFFVIESRAPPSLF